MNWRAFLGQVFVLSGYQVLLAEDGPEALLLWQQNLRQINLLYTDMVLPGGLSGLDLVEQMQAENPALPAIISSGHDPEFIGLHEPTAAVFTFLKKPANIQEITRLVSQLLPRANSPLRLIPGGL